MTPEQAYEWLAPKLDLSERKVLDVIYRAAVNVETIPARYIHLDANGNLLADQAEPIPAERMRKGDRIQTLHRKIEGGPA